VAEPRKAAVALENITLPAPRLRIAGSTARAAANAPTTST